MTLKKYAKYVHNLIDYPDLQLITFALMALSYVKNLINLIIRL